MLQGNKKYILIFLVLLLWGAALFIVERFSLLHAAPQEETQEELSQDDNFEEVNVEKVEVAQEEIIPEEEEVPFCGLFPCMSAQDFVDLFNLFERNANLSFLRKYIFQDELVDNYLRNLAESRGYQQRGFADPKKIIHFENVETYPEVRDAYIQMRNEMVKEGMRLHFVSGYRSSTHQRTLIKNKLLGVQTELIPSGIYDELIDTTLKVSALPGYSKHHTGYAVDFGCGDDYLVYTFASTNCYEWLSAENFENAKRYGFIPSYPEGSRPQGPDPEPWEFVWVSPDILKNFSPKTLEDNEEPIENGL